MRLIYCLIWLIMLTFGVVFGLLNPQLVRIDYLTHSTQVFLPLLLVVAILLGILLGCLALSPRLLHYRRQNRSLRKQLGASQQQLEYVDRLHQANGSREASA